MHKAGETKEDADPVRAKLGPASITNPDEIAEMKKKLKENGVEIRGTSKGIAYEPKPHTNSQHSPVFCVDEDDSYCAWLHEYQHFLDDKESNWNGFRLMSDNNTHWDMEYRGYMAEINYLRNIKKYNLAKEVLSLARKEKKKIYGQ